MAFLRFTRDKRGYEHFALVQPTTNRRGKVRTRILYWFRTPPNVKVGRQPFDEPLRRALEAQNPGVTFDWQNIIETPIPSADAEKWRERRRMERVERAARHAESEEDATAEQPVADVPPSTDEQTTEAPPSDAVDVRATPPEDRRRRRRRRGRRGRPERPVDVGRPEHAKTAATPGEPLEPPEPPEPQ